MEELSLTVFWLALGLTAASVMFCWGYSFGARVALRRLATSAGGAVPAGRQGFASGENGDGGVTVATLEWLPESLGIALGAYWGNSAWGRYRGWGPKETAALVTGLIYAA